MDKNLLLLAESDYTCCLHAEEYGYIDFTRHLCTGSSTTISIINLLTPNVNYSGHTAPLTSKVAFYIFIQQIQVLNILNMVYTLSFFLFKMQFV